MQGPGMEELLRPHPRLLAWLDRVRSACSPHYDGEWQAAKLYCANWDFCTSLCFECHTVRF
jgi:hypothetical protein